jgi:hypothetical protein
MADTIKLNPQPRRRLLPEQDAIEYLGLHTRDNPKGSLRWLMRSGKLAYIRLAKGVYGFQQTDLDSFIEANRVAAGWPRR